MGTSALGEEAKRFFFFGPIAFGQRSEMSVFLFSTPKKCFPKSWQKKQKKPKAVPGCCHCCFYFPSWMTHLTKRFGQSPRCSIERFLVVGEGGLAATLKRRTFDFPWGFGDWLWLRPSKALASVWLDREVVDRMEWNSSIVKIRECSNVLKTKTQKANLMCPSWHSMGLFYGSVSLSKRNSPNSEHP